MEPNLNNIVKELSNINKNLQSINLTLKQIEAAAKFKDDATPKFREGMELKNS